MDDEKRQTVQIRHVLWCLATGINHGGPAYLPWFE